MSSISILLLVVFGIGTLIRHKSNQWFIQNKPAIIEEIKKILAEDWMPMEDLLYELHERTYPITPGQFVKIIKELETLKIIQTDQKARCIGRPQSNATWLRLAQ